MVIDITSHNLQENLASEQLVVIDFYAPWCGPCMMLKPVFKKVAESFAGKCICAQVNIDESREIALAYRISSIPTLIAIKNKKIVWMHTGMMSEADLKNKIETAL